jgi:pimeloyl-ACP methyl ester carboxylesterase
MGTADGRDIPPVTDVTVSSGGLRLAAHVCGDATPAVLFMHGYPDTSRVWEPIVERLSPTRRCITYDMRGAGASDAPIGRDGYRVGRLVDDLVAVLDSTSPDVPVHLVGHDWGSVVAWEVACRADSDPRLVGRLASLTSISGPCLAHIGSFYRAARRASWRSHEGRRLKRDAAAQAARSWYVYALQAPGAERVVRARTRRMVERRGADSQFGPTLPDDAANGIGLYRANVRNYERIAGGARTQLPALLVVPVRDRYIGPALARSATRFAPNLRRADVDAGHWAIWTRPAEVAGLIADFVGSQ